MRFLQVVLSVCIMVVLIGVSGPTAEAQKKATDKEKIVGSWELVKATSDGKAVDLSKADSNSTFTNWIFTSEAKLSRTVEAKKFKGKRLKLESTYEVDGDVLKITYKLGDNERLELQKISKLTDEELILTEKKGDVVRIHEFKKKP